MVLAAVVAVVAWAVTSGGSGPAALPGFTISVSQGSVASPDSIIESQPSLARLISAHLHYVPFEAGVTAIAEMKSGAVQAISGVGNPPVTEAIGNGTGVTVVMGWGFDDDQLLVPASVTSPAQLAGKSVAVLVGSSEDYELLGYLALQHLTGTVKVVPFSDETAAGAAALSGAVDAAYVYGSPATKLTAKGYHPLVNAQQIAKLGVPGLHERDDPELDQEAAALLERVGLGGFGDAFPHELSGGMRHRAAFARALASRPSLLLMDEPFGALDAITRERMHEFLLDIWEQHRITIIFVTHDLDEAILLGDRVAVMGGPPPGIGEVIDIPLTRPRHTRDTDTEVFLAAKRRIRAALRS